MNDDDQVVTIIVRDRHHTAIGAPNVIYSLLVTGREVVCSASEPFAPYSVYPKDGDYADYVLRLSPGTPFNMTYPEATIETIT